MSRKGQNNLLSTQTFFFDEEGGRLSDRVEVETFDYPAEPVLAEHPNADALRAAAKVKSADMSHRTRALYAWYSSAWHEVEDASSETFYEYQDGQLTVAYTASPLGCSVNDTCDYQFIEGNGYDIFGRRVMHTSTTEVDTETGTFDPDSPSFWLGFYVKSTEARNAVVNYDYLGLSQQVLAERRGPAIKGGVENPPPHVVQYDQDRFIATYTPGPLGLAERVDEDPEAGWRSSGTPGIGDPAGGNVLIGDNVVRYTLTDAQGFRGAIQWTGGLSGSKDPSLFGELVLAKE